MRTLVFLKGDVQLPIQTVFDAPVVAHHGGEATGRDELAQDIVAIFSNVFSIAMSVADGNSNRL